MRQKSTRSVLQNQRWYLWCAQEVHCSEHNYKNSIVLSLTPKVCEWVLLSPDTMERSSVSFYPLFLPSFFLLFLCFPISLFIIIIIIFRFVSSLGSLIVLLFPLCLFFALIFAVPISIVFRVTGEDRPFVLCLSLPSSLAHFMNITTGQIFH